MPRYLFSYPKDDNDFRPNQRLNKQLKIVKKRKETKVYNRNGWDEDENRKYRQFLEANSDLLNNRQQRRQKKVFLRLSQYVETRDANQCRSHHQKMIQKYKTIDRILEFLRYLEDREIVVEKENSTCQQSPQIQPCFSTQHIKQIDHFLTFNKKDSLFDGLFGKSDYENYFNRIEEQIWEL